MVLTTEETTADAVQQQQPINEVEAPPATETEKDVVPKGKYTPIGFDLDATGRRLMDEIIHIAGYAGKDRTFQDFIMPYMNINPATRGRHQLRVITVGFYRMLKSSITFKVIRSKAEIFALTAFLEWLESLLAKDADSKGIIIIYHEERCFMPLLLIEAMKRYNMQDRFFKSVAGFFNLRKKIKANPNEALQHFSLPKLYKILLEDNDRQRLEKELEFFEGSADARARLAFKVAAQFFQAITKSQSDTAADAAEALIDMDKLKEDFVDCMQSYLETPKKMLATLKLDLDLLKRQSSFRDVFSNYMRSTPLYRNRAMRFRFALADKGYTLSFIKEIWNDKGKESLMKLFDDINSFKREDKEELSDLFDRFFDPNRSALKLQVGQTYRRPYLLGRYNNRYDNGRNFNARRSTRSTNKENKPRSKARVHPSDNEQGAGGDKRVTATAAPAPDNTSYKAPDVAEKASNQPRSEADPNKGEPRGQRNRINNVRGGRGRNNNYRRRTRQDSSDRRRTVLESDNGCIPVQDDSDVFRAVEDGNDGRRIVQDNNVARRTIEDNNDGRRTVQDNNDRRRTVQDSNDRRRREQDNNDRRRTVQDNGNRRRTVQDNENRRRTVQDSNDRRRAMQDNDERRRTVQDSNERRRTVQDNKYRRRTVPDIKDRRERDNNDRRRPEGTQNERRRSEPDDNDHRYKEEDDDRRHTEQTSDRRQSEKKSRKNARNNENASQRKDESGNRRFELDTDSFSSGSNTDDDDGSKSPDRRDKQRRAPNNMRYTSKRNQRNIRRQRNELPRTNTSSQTTVTISKERHSDAVEQRVREEQRDRKSSSADVEELHSSGHDRSNSHTSPNQEQTRSQKRSETGGATRNSSQPPYERDNNNEPRQDVSTKPRNNYVSPRNQRNRNGIQRGHNNGPTQMATQQPLAQRN